MGAFSVDWRKTAQGWHSASKIRIIEKPHSGFPCSSHGAINPYINLSHLVTVKRIIAEMVAGKVPHRVGATHTHRYSGTKSQQM